MINTVDKLNHNKAYLDLSGNLMIEWFIYFFFCLAHIWLTGLNAKKKKNYKKSDGYFFHYQENKFNYLIFFLLLKWSYIVKLVLNSFTSVNYFQNKNDKKMCQKTKKKHCNLDNTIFGSKSVFYF